MNPFEGIPEADLDLLTRIVIGEAEGSGPLGQQAVASVVGNRMEARGQTAQEVITAPSQFEPWGNEQRRAQIMAISPTDPRYVSAQQNVMQVVNRQVPDPTGGATHFYSPGAMAQRGQGAPSWAQGVPSQDIGGNRFLRLDPQPERAPPGAPTEAPVPMPRPSPDAPPATMAQRGLGAYVQQQQAAQANPANWVELGNQSAIRNLPITDTLRTNLERSVEQVYGPGFRARVYSGGQPALGSGGRRVGSTRHDGGNAADVYIYDPQGRRVTGDGLAPLARHWISNGFGGVGLEMRGGGIHLDTHQDRAPFWAYRPLTPGQQAAVQEGLAARRSGQPTTAVAYAQPQPRPANAGVAAIDAATARPPVNSPAGPVTATAAARGPITTPPDTITGGSGMNEQTAEKPVPATIGGLGGLGGFQPLAGGRFGEMLQMVGMALLSSPGNAPLQNLPALALTMQKSRTDAEEREYNRRRQQTLDDANLDDRRSSTEMRRLQMRQIQAEIERQANDARILAGGAPGAPASPAPAPAPSPAVTPPADTITPASPSAPAAPAGTATSQATPPAAPAAAPTAAPQPSSPTDMQIARIDRVISDPRLSPQARQQLIEQKNKLLSNFTFQTRPDGSVIRIDKTDNSVREIRPASNPPRIVTIKNPTTGQDETVEQLPDGTLRRPTVQGESPAPGNPYATGSFNDTQGKAAGFADRMFEAERVLQRTEPAMLSTIDRGLSGIPIVGNRMVSNDYQQGEQAQRTFINSVLRRESGAVISPSEFENARRQYFPQPGDSPETLAQKRAARRQAIAGMAREGGPSYRPGLTFDDKGNVVERQPQGQQQGQQQSGNVPRINSPQEYQALRSGDEFIAPDGTRRRKP